MRQEEYLKLERKVEEVNDWRHRPVNVYTCDGLALVSKAVTTGRDLNVVVKAAVDAIGGVRSALQPQARGVLDAAKTLDLPIIDFDAGPWMDVRLGEQAKCWKAAAYHQSLKSFDKIVYLPCMKHHFLATFTMSLKLTVGLTHPVEMQYMHADFDQGKTDEPMYLKMIELSLPGGPDLIIMDGRKSFVTGGPDNGDVVEPNVILASGDRIALGVEGVKILQSYPRENLIQAAVWEMPIICRAIELGLGIKSEADYKVL